MGKPKSKNSKPIIGTNIRIEFSVIVKIKGITNKKAPNTIKIIPILVCFNKLIYFTYSINIQRIFNIIPLIKISKGKLQ